MKGRKQAQVQNELQTHLELQWKIVAGKAIWKNSSKRRALGQPAWALHPVWIQRFLTDTKGSAVPHISRVLMVSAAMDETCIKKCSPGDFFNDFLVKLLKTGVRVKFYILTLTSRAGCTSEKPLFLSFSGNLCVIQHSHLTFAGNRWGPC